MLQKAPAPSAAGARALIRDLAGQHLPAARLLELLLRPGEQRARSSPGEVPLLAE